jgi:REP element-mobilizing transposase RayT
MPGYRRYRVPGGTYFCTINLLDRRTDLPVRHIEALREAVRRIRVRNGRSLSTPGPSPARPPALRDDLTTGRP